MSMQTFWERLQQARLFRVVVVYLAAAWLVLEVTGELADTLALPSWVPPVAFLLLLVGFVVVTATAWVQSTPRAERPASGEPGPWDIGLRDLGTAVSRGRAPHLTWGRAVAGGIAAFFLLTVIVAGYVGLRPAGSALPTLDDDAAPALAVLPFRTSSADLDVYREGMVDLLATNLDGLGGLRTIASRTVLARWKDQVGGGADGADLSTSLGVARAAGGRWALLGSVVALGPEIRLGAELYDAAGGAALGGPVMVQGHPDSVLALVDRLSVEVARRLLAEAGPSGLSDSAGIPGGSAPELASVTTHSPAALRAYLEGSAAMRRSAFPEAIRAFEEAVAEDSTFALALAHLGHAHGWAESAGSEATVRYRREAARYMDRLSPREALLVRASVSLAEGDPGMLPELRRAVRTWPDDPAMWYVLGEFHKHLGPQALTDGAEAWRAFGRAIALDPGYAPAYIHPIEYALVEGKREEAERLLEAYAGLAGEDRWMPRFRLAHRLAWGDEATRAQALAALDTVDLTIATPALGLLPWPAGLELAERAAARLAARSESGFAEARWRVNALVTRGRYAAALAELDPDVLGGPWGAHLLFLMAWSGHEPAAERLGQLPVERLEAGKVGHLLVAAHAADEGDWDRLSAGIDEQRGYGRESVAGGDTLLADFHEGAARALEGYGLLRRGEPEKAAVLLEAIRREFTGVDGAHTLLNAWTRMWLAEALEASGRARDALRYWESVSVHQLSWTHFRRAELHARLGEEDQARRQYAIFLEAWKDADPELPHVRLAEEALSRLAAGR